VRNDNAVNREIDGETTSGVRTDYLADALGSVTGTVNRSAKVLNTYRYKPYGALLAKTGVATDPKSQWVGTLGYRATSRAQRDYYVGPAHYGTASGRYTSVSYRCPTTLPYALLLSDMGPGYKNYGFGYSNSCPDKLKKRYPGPWRNKLKIDCTDDRDREAFSKAISDLRNGGQELATCLASIEQNCAASSSGQSGTDEANQAAQYIRDPCSGQAELATNCPGNWGLYYPGHPCAVKRECVIDMVDRPSDREVGCPPFFRTILHKLLHVPLPHIQRYNPKDDKEFAHDLCYFGGRQPDCYCFSCGAAFNACKGTKLYSNTAGTRTYRWEDCKDLPAHW